ncbi:ABC transporter permease subunit [Sediminibacterium ginsengisoli]|uniref:ABC-2 type transport system permease protein n=1 Tax=Sediminibacterium ginsengisoli TaxID=413434 RepID=A0A1T4PQR1_9BACT|nr:ABC transporter permease subunit [Sediminibacterium ginsengisoli]SJZ93641.1 ABC-2 type transport system permease protein [Sediminibacterium ginsengisoli]
MSLRRIVFAHEWRQLLRQRWLPGALLIFLLAGLLSIGTGYRDIRIRNIQVDSIRQTSLRDFQSVASKLADTSTEQAKKDAASAGMAVMVNFRLPQTAIKVPEPLGPLALGIADIQPWHYVVKYVKDYQPKEDVPVNNPMSLLAGGFDLAFVIVFILPLLVSVFCFSVFSAEKDAGTLPMLIVQAGDMHRIIRLKFIFRFLLLASCVLVLDVSAFVIIIPVSGFSLKAALTWTLVSLLYLLFWTGIAYLLVSFKRNAAVTGLYLVGAWLLLLILIPSAFNTYVQSRYPVPMRDEIASYRREQGEKIWATSPRVLSDSFNRIYPEYLSSANPAKDTLKLSTRYVAGYYALLSARMERKMLPLQQLIDQRNHRFGELSRWNPALSTQKLFSSLAGNDLGSYTQFKQQVNMYQAQWQSALYAFHIPDIRLSLADLNKLPEFTYQPVAVAGGEIAAYMAVMIVLTFILLLFAEIRFTKDRLVYR